MALYKFRIIIIIINSICHSITFSVYTETRLGLHMVIGQSP